MERRALEHREFRLRQTKEAIAARILPMVPGMQPEEFDRLVSRMARIELKYASRRTDDLFAGQGSSPVDESAGST